MKLTKDNLIAEFPQVKAQIASVNADLAAEYDRSISSIIEFYDDDEEIAITVDMFIDKCNQALAQSDDKPAEKSKGKKLTADDVPQGTVLLKNGELKRVIMWNHTQEYGEKKARFTGVMATDGQKYAVEEIKAINKEGKVELINAKESKPRKPKSPKEPKPKKEKSKKEPKVDTRMEVEDKSAAVKIITRFVKLHGKTVCVTTKETARRILAVLQKAALYKQIRKTDEYAKEIMDIQDSLIKITKLKNGDISIKGIEHYKEIADNYKNMQSATLIRSFITIQGKEGVKTKAKNLLAKVDKYLVESTKQQYRSEVMAIAASLHDYVDDKTDTPEMSELQLNGLYGLAGIECKPKSGSAVNSREFLGAHFQTLDFTGVWKRLIGKPESHFRIMMYGKPGSGKSTLSIQFAHYLAGMGKRVLYIADEEKYGYTLQEKIKRLNAHHANLFFIDKVPTEKTYFKQWDIIFIDSVQSAGLEVEDLERLADKLAPHASFVYVFQSTKSGQFRGENTYAHDVDTVIRVEDMIATTEKNRFGASGTVKVI